MRFLVRIRNSIRKRRSKRRRGRSLSFALARWHISNLCAAAKHPDAVWRDARALRTLKEDMARVAMSGPQDRADGSSRIDSIHFVYGLKTTEEFPAYAAFSVLSAHVYHPTARIFFFCTYVPVGAYWDLVKTLVHVVPVPPFDWFGVARVRHYAHKADVVRLLALETIGGLYLDCDTITLRNMDDLSAHDFVMGVQQSVPGFLGGLCNAIMIGRSGSRFARHWLALYRSFRSAGRDKYWDFHSVKLPLYMYARDPDAVFVLPHDAWFFPLWTSIHDLMFSPGEIDAKLALFDKQRAVHLWNNMTGAYLDRWSFAADAAPNTVYDAMVGRVHDQLPETIREALTAARPAPRPPAA